MLTSGRSAAGSDAAPASSVDLGREAAAWTYAASVQVRHIASPLTDAFTAGLDDDIETLRERMTRLQYDHVPVICDGVPIGLVSSPLEPVNVQYQMTRLTADLLVSADTLISELMSHLAEEPFLFVLQGRRITGFVTTADLGSAPVRTHFYLLIATLETLLYRYLAHRWDDQMHAVALLNAPRLRAFLKLEAQLRKDDLFIDPLSSVSIGDLLWIADKGDPGFRESVTATGLGWRKATDGVTKFRNDVMHPSRPLPADVRRMMTMERQLRRLIEAAEAATRDLLSTPKRPQPRLTEDPHSLLLTTGASE